MKRLARVFIGIISAVLAGVLLSGVSMAYQLIASPHELSSSPLLLTGYQRNDEKSLRYIQLYNNGNEPIDLNQWRVFLNARQVATSNNINILSHVEGYLLPAQHIMFSVAAETYAFGAYPLVASATSSPLTDIAIYPPVDTLLTTDFYDLSSKSAELRAPMQRTITPKNTYNTTFSVKTPLVNTDGTVDYQYFRDELYTPPENAGHLQIVEIYPYAKSCSPLETDILCHDYVKFYNPTVEPINLDGFILRTDSNSSNRTVSNTINLSGYVIQPDEYISVDVLDNREALSLTNSGGYVWLEDTWGLTRYDETMTEYASAGINQQGSSWAQTDEGIWKWTALPTPAAENRFPIELISNTQPTDCPVGKYRSPETNRCRTIEEAVNALSACPEGQERNVLTNRCRSSFSTTSGLVPCKEGQERNSETNRCRSIASAVAELIPCDEGYERNPSTNRCRKVLGDSILASAASPASIPISERKDGNITRTLVVGAAASAIAYGLYEWRSEFMRALRRTLGFLKR